MFYLSSVIEKNIQIFNQKTSVKVQYVLSEFSDREEYPNINQKTSVKVQYILSEFSDREEYPNIQSEDICQGAICFI